MRGDGCRWGGGPIVGAKHVSWARRRRSTRWLGRFQTGQYAASANATRVTCPSTVASTTLHNLKQYGRGWRCDRYCSDW